MVMRIVHESPLLQRPFRPEDPAIVVLQLKLILQNAAHLHIRHAEDLRHHPRAPGLHQFLAVSLARERNNRAVAVDGPSLKAPYVQHSSPIWNLDVAELHSSLFRQNLDARINAIVMSLHIHVLITVQIHRRGIRSLRIRRHLQLFLGRLPPVRGSKRRQAKKQTQQQTRTAHRVSHSSSPKINQEPVAYSLCPEPPAAVAVTAACFSTSCSWSWAPVF